jgi:hypothetical protein
VRPALLLFVLAGCGRLGFADPGTVELDTSSLEFPGVGCGGVATSTFALHNGGDVALGFTITSNLTGVTAEPATGSVPPGADVTVTVTAMTEAVGSPGAAMTGELLVQTDGVSVDPIQLPVSLTTIGGLVSADLTTVDFGQVTTSMASMRTVTIGNTGNSAVTISAGPFVNPAFAVIGEATFDLPPGGTHPVAIQFVPTISQAYSFQLPLATAGAICGPAPTVVVAGTGTTNTVLLDHTTIDFGAISCGTPSGGMPLLVTNQNATSYPYVASVTQGAASFTAAPTSGTVPASGSTSITVTHAAVAAPIATGQVSGNLHLVITGAPNGTNDVGLKYAVSGSSLTASPLSYDFGQVEGTGSTTIVITNTGNQVADVQVIRSGSSHFSAPSSFQVSPGSMKDMTITFSSSSTSTSTADFALSASNQCSSPLSIHVSGRGDN